MQNIFYLKLRQAKKLLPLNVRLAFSGGAIGDNFSTFALQDTIFVHSPSLLFPLNGWTRE